jgi:hypothetical protein
MIFYTTSFLFARINRSNMAEFKMAAMIVLIHIDRAVTSGTICIHLVFIFAIISNGNGCFQAIALITPY